MTRYLPQVEAVLASLRAGTSTRAERDITPFWPTRPSLTIEQDRYAWNDITISDELLWARDPEAPWNTVKVWASLTICPGEKKLEFLMGAAYKNPSDHMVRASSQGWDIVWRDTPRLRTPVGTTEQVAQFASRASRIMNILGTCSGSAEPAVARRALLDVYHILHPMPRNGPEHLAEVFLTVYPIIVAAAFAQDNFDDSDTNEEE